MVNNVETMSNLPWIVRNGGAAFAALGEGRSTGTRLFALAGHVNNPGVFELEMVKTTFDDLINAPVLGGGIPHGRSLKAFIPGGVSAPWFGPDQIELPLGQDEVAAAGSMLGSGSIVVMDDHTCVVRAAWRITKFFFRESCGQCTPCREGSGWLERILERIETGQGRDEDLDLLLDACDNIAPGLSWPPSRPPSACSGRPSPRRSSRPSRCSATSSSSTSRMAGVPMPEPTTPPQGNTTVANVADDATSSRSVVTAGRDGDVHAGRAVGHGRKGEMLIAAAERAGTFIPRFCYHPRMKSVGVCRMCLVEVSGPGAHPPAQLLRRGPGRAEVVTDSDKVKKAQDGVLEFLLINHPLDCPVCDKGGECPLQDQTLAYGPGETRFVEEKRHFEKPIPISELVLLDRERCIQCSRCTRFADEVAGEAQIDFIGRGEKLEVNTFPELPFASYFSGNTVQICPVGALTAVPYRFAARPWDLDQVESTCTTCSVGCRVAVQSSSNRRHPVARDRRRPRQPRMAVRQGAVRLRRRQQRGAAGRTPGPQGRRAGPDVLARGARRRGRRPQRRVGEVEPGRSAWWAAPD